MCGSHATRVVQRIPAAKLIEAYRQELGIVPALGVDELAYLACSACGLLFFDPPVTGDQKFYEALQKISWYYSAEKQEFRIAAAYVRAPDHVLEIGAGRGLFAREITPASYTGLEFSTAAVELAAASGVRLVAESIEHHAAANPGKYDFACAFQVLEHVSDPRSFLRAAVAALRVGGRLVVSVPGEDSFARYAVWDVLNMPPHHVTRWTDECLRKVGPLCGLDTLALTPEPLGRNMRRAYAQANATQWLAQRLHFEPQLIDPRVRTPLFRSLSVVAASGVRRLVSLTNKRRRGHAVVAVFEKNKG